MSMLKTLRPFIVLLVACSLTSCTTTNGSVGTGKAPAENATVQTDGPKLVVSVEQPEWARGGPLWVTLEIRNPGKTDIRGIAALRLVKQPKEELERNSLWAPLVLQETSAIPASRPAPSVVKAGQELKFKVDVQQLKWARSISSMWPSEDLFSVGSGGDYSLYLDIQIKEGKTVTPLKSNEVKVSLH